MLEEEDIYKEREEGRGQGGITESKQREEGEREGGRMEGGLKGDINTSKGHRGREEDREGGGQREGKRCARLTPTFLRRSPTMLRAEIRVEGV